MKKKEFVSDSGKKTFMALKLQAKLTGKDIHAVALRFALERFLGRVFAKENELLYNPMNETTLTEGQITVKGGMLMCIAENKNPLDSRATSDADLHIPGFKGSVDKFAEIVSEALKHDDNAMDDGIRFHVDDISVAREKDGENTGGTITIPLQIGDLFLKIKSDVTFDGRAMHLDAPTVEYQSVLPHSGLGKVTIRQTPWEYVLADKVCAMASMGEKNYRIRDYNDVFVILNNGLVDLEKAADILKQNAGFKGLELPENVADMGALSQAFIDRQAPRWEKEGTDKNFSAPASLHDTISLIREKLNPILEKIAGIENNQTQRL